MHPTTAWLRDLVRIPSVNPMGRPLEGPDIFEHQITRYLEDQFRLLGVRHERHSIAPLRDNIIAFFEPPQARSTILFEVHQDTVPVDNMTIDPFGAIIEGGRLFGRGACDVKGGLASMLGAFARLVRENPSHSARVILACTVDEESTFLGVQHLARQNLRSQPAMPLVAIVAEPTDLDIVHSHKGVIRWNLTTSGRSCHSSRPERGINAIYHMGALLDPIQRYASELRAKVSHPLLGPATLSVGRIEGGTSVNTVPDRCRIEIDRRVLPGERPGDVIPDFERFFSTYAPQDISFSCSAPYLNCPALSPDLSTELVARLGTAINSVRGHHQVMAVPYGTDASTLAEAGIPSVVFGPGSIEQAHTSNEWIDLDEVEAASEILFRFALDFALSAA